MIHLIADERHACAHAHGELTVGSRGIPVQVGLSDDFDGLAVTICFQAGTERAEVVWYEGEEIYVPPQCLTKEGERLLVGVYGAKADGTVVIPTIWATAGIVKRGTNLTGASPLDPEPDWTAQVQSIAAEAIETANAVKAAADAGEFDGYSPSASVTKSGDTATITITDKDGTTTASIRDGYDTSGSVVQDGTTAIITLTDHDGTTRAEVHDGISPSASVAQTSTGATVTVTDRSGTTTAQLTNGATGPQGERGPAGPKGDTGDGATRIEYGSGIILVQCDSDGKTKAYGGGFDVRAFVGAERQACTATIDYAPSWLTINVTNNASGTPVVRYSWQQGQAASNATVGMTVTTTDVSGAEVTYPCTLNVTTVRDGAAGAAGEDGYGFVPVDGTFVPIHTNPDDTTRAGRHELIFEAYSGSEELAITGMTFQGPSWMTATQSSIAPTLLVLTWPDGETLVDSVGCSLTVTIDDHGTTRYEYSEIVVGAVKDGADGYSPTVTVAPITGGHEVTVTDAGGSQSFDVMDGKDGQKLTKALTGTIVTASDAYAVPPVDATVYGNSTQDGTPTPSAPVPIESVDELTLHAAGKNLLDAANPTTIAVVTYTYENDTLTVTATNATAWSYLRYRVSAVEWMQGQTATLSTIASSTGTPFFAIEFYRADDSRISYAVSNTQAITGTVPNDASYINVLFYARNTQGGAVGDTSTYRNIQLELGSTATDYEPYDGHNVPIDLQDHVLRSLPDGTKDTMALSYLRPSTREGWAVYGASLVQVVGSVMLDGTQNWFLSASGTYTRFGTSSVLTSACVPIADKLAYYQLADLLTHPYGINAQSNNRIYVSLDETITTGAQAKAWFVDNPVTVQYKLATPVTHDLGTVELPANPAPDMTAWADGGSATPSLSLTYERDIGIVIAELQGEVERTWAQLAPVEQETATANHAVGTYLVLGGTFCKVTRAIATGEAVAIGTNVAATTVAAELLAIQA